MNLLWSRVNAPMTKIMIFITYLGNWQIIIGLGIIIVIGLLILREKRMALFLVVGTASGELFYALLKNIIQRPRPDIINALIEQNGYSFPSGHSLVPLIFYGMLGYYFFRKAKSLPLKTISIIAPAILVFLIGFSRVYLGVHWVSDVLAGWIFGAIFLTILIRLFNKKS